MVTFRMRTGLSVMPFASAGTCEIFSTTSMPSVTRPNAEYWPSSEGCGATHTKNCAPSLLGLLGMRTVETTPRSCFRSLNSAGSRLSPPVPQRFARRLRILEQRVAALNDAVGHHAMERAAVVVALAGERDELLHVLRRLVGREFEAESAEVGGDDGLDVIR